MQTTTQEEEVEYERIRCVAGHYDVRALSTAHACGRIAIEVSSNTVIAEVKGEQCCTDSLASRRLAGHQKVRPQDGAVVLRANQSGIR